MLALGLILVMRFAGADQVCVEGAITRQSKNPVVETENADHVGFCGNFASRDLLHQAICKHAKTPSDCFQPAVMDGLSQMADLVLDANPNAAMVGPEEMMRKVLERGITREECNSFNAFFKPENLSAKYYDIRHKYADRTFKVKLGQCRKEQYAKRGLGECPRAEEPLTKDTTAKAVEIFCEADIQKDMETSEGYLNRAIQSWANKLDCPRTKLNPSFTLKSKPIPENVAERGRAINDRLDSGFPVQVTRSGPHSFVLANYRYICRRGKEVMQYQVIDSLYGSTFSATNKPIDWADATGLSVGALGWGILNKLDTHFEMHWLEQTGQK